MSVTLGNTPKSRRPLTLWTVLALSLAATFSTALAVSTSYWTQNSQGDFEKGTFHNVVVTSLGDLKLSRSVKTLLDEDPLVSGIHCMTEGPDGTIYAGAAPRGLVLAVKDQTVSTLADFGDDRIISALLFDKDHHLLVGVSGESGKVYRIDNPSVGTLRKPATTKAGKPAARPVDRPVPKPPIVVNPEATTTAGEPDKAALGVAGKAREIFSADGVQFIWAMQQTPDGHLYIATGPAGQLFDVDAEGKSSVLFASDEDNLLSLISDGKDLLYVGSDPDGLIYRVNRKTKDAYVMYQAAEAEVSCLALDAKGNLYAGTAESSEQQGPPPEAPKETEGRPEGATLPPLPSTAPSIPKPPAVPAPGDPNPIPRKRQVRGNASSEAILAARDLRFEISDLRLAADNATSQIVDPNSAGACSARPVAEANLRSQISNLKFAPASPIAGLLLLDNPKSKIQNRKSNFIFLDDPQDPNQPPAPPPKKEPHFGPPTSGPAPTPPGPQAEVEQPKANGNAVYRIDPKGFVTEIFRAPVLIFSLVEHNGTLLAGTGSEGLIYQISPQKDETAVIARVDSKQVVCLLAASDGRIMVGTANAGTIATMGAGYASDGTFTSPPLDATQVSRFGNVHLHGSLPPGTSLMLSTRSGNMRDSAKAGWSAWTEPVAATQYTPVTSPSARFLQYRLIFASKDASATPVVNQVDTAYQVPNLAPVVKAVKVASAAAAAGDSSDKTNAAANPTGGTRTLAIVWDAEDPNGDALQFSLYYRTGPSSPWVLMKDKLTDTHFDWDTQKVADGRYEVKVVASDALANPVGEGLTASRVTDPFIVDNTPPVISDAKATVHGATVTIDADLADATSTLASSSYSVDAAEDWQSVLPSDRIFDSPEAKVSFSVNWLAPGQHQITLRATDSKGNQAFKTLLVTIETPAEKR